MPQVAGFQDYSRLSVQAGQELYSNNVQITNGYQSPILDIVGFAFVNLSVAGIINVNWIVAQLVWYKDNLASSQAGAVQFSCGPQSNGAIQYPVLSRWARINVFSPTAPSTDSPTVEAFGSNGYAPNIHIQQFDAPLLYQSASVAAAGNITLQATNTYEGEVSVYANTSSGSAFTVQLQWYDVQTQTWKVFLSTSPPAGSSTVLVQTKLPPTAVRMVLINNDSVARTLTGCLTT